MSTLKVGTIQNTSGVEVYTCKAWVNFNGTGTVAIRAAGNVSSITDNGTGDYTVNFTTALSDANYAVVQMAGTPGVTSAATCANFANTTTISASAFRFKTNSGAATTADLEQIHTAIFR